MTEVDVSALATKIKPVLSAEGQHETGLGTKFFNQEGKTYAPVAVFYEHQYLAYQFRTREKTGKIVADRVPSNSASHSERRWISLVHNRFWIRCWPPMIGRARARRSCSMINALDDGDDLLHVNLGRRTVERNVALERAMAKAGDTSGRLRKLKSFVLVEGDFRDGGEIEDGRIYLAPIGDEQDGPQVRVECEKKLLADKKSRPNGPFVGVCLVRVLSWEDPDLTVRPIAIFL